MRVDTRHLPDLVRSYLARALPPDLAVPAAMQVEQTGEMWKRPGARPMAFEATEEFSVDRVAFTWHARFPIVGPLTMTLQEGRFVYWRARVTTLRPI
jgi:hypothetical protein